MDIKFIKIKPEYKIFEDETNWEQEIKAPTPQKVVSSPISLSQIKKKKKKKDKEKMPEKQNNMILERKKREQRLKNLMK